MSWGKTSAASSWSHSYEESDKIIIQCPNCQTKFGVEKSVVENISEALNSNNSQSQFQQTSLLDKNDLLKQASLLKQPLRFHCSRCDNIFETALEEESFDDFAPNNSNNNLNTIEKLSNTAPLIEENSFLPRFSAHCFSAHSIRDLYQSNTSCDISSSLDAIKANELARQDNSKNLELSLLEGEDQLSLPQVSPHDSHQLSLIDQNSFSSRLKENEINSPSFDFLNAKVEPKQPKNKQLTLAESPSTSLHKPYLDNKYLENEASQAAILRVSGIKALALLVLPIFTLLTLLFISSQIIADQDLQSSPIKSFLYNAPFLPELPSPPPASLRISHLSYEQHTLASGEEIALIKGAVTNKGEQVIENPRIEGVIFNSVGKPILTLESFVSDSLSRIRLEKLSVNLIDTISKNPSRKIKRLPVGEKSNFAIAIPLTTLSEARYYNVRVSSASTIRH